MKLLITLVLLTACGSTTLRGRGDSSTIAMQITMKIKPEFEQAFVDFAGQVVQKTYDEEPGVLTYTMYKHPTEPSTYVFIERYRDNAAYETHMSKPYMADAMEKLPTWLAAPPVEEKYTQLLPR